MNITITVTAAQLTPYRARAQDRERSREGARPHVARAADQPYIYRPWLARRYAVRRRHRILWGPPKAAVLGTDVSGKRSRN